MLNDEGDFERAYKLGAAGVMTDFPSKLRQFLKNNPQYLPKSSDYGAVESSELLRDRQTC